MKKKIILIIVSLIIILLLGLLIVLVINVKDKEYITPVNLSAKSIVDRYRKIEYGEPVKLKGNIVTNSGSYVLTGRYECITINSIGNVQLKLEDAEIYCNRGPAIYVEDSNLLNIDLSGKSRIESYTTLDLEGAIYTKDNLIFSGDGSVTIFSNHDGIVSKDSLMFESGTYNIISEENAIKGRDSVVILDGTYEIESKLDGIKSVNDQKVQKGFIVIDDGTFTIKSQSDAIQAETNLLINNGTFNISTNGNANLLSAKGLKGINLVQVKNGTFTINTVDDSIHSDNQILIVNGNLEVKSYDDAIHSDGIFQMEHGTITLNAREGIESTNLIINGGTITINGSENGLSAGNRNPRYKQGIEIHGGNITINMGDGETYGIDSSDYVTITGGKISVDAKNPFNYTGKATYTGGTIKINGRRADKIPEMEVVERVNTPPPGANQPQPQ